MEDVKRHEVSITRVGDDLIEFSINGNFRMLVDEGSFFWFVKDIHSFMTDPASTQKVSLLNAHIDEVAEIE